MLDFFKRYQQGFKIENLFPVRNDGLCSCGCNEKLFGRKKKWFSKTCLRYALNTYYIVKGDVQVIRENLYQIDKGFCRGCGVQTKEWHADHIIPVFKGGGACGIDNFQTLCVDCHKEKSSYLDRIPNRNDIFTTSLNVLPSPNYTFRTFNEGVCEHVV